MPRREDIAVRTLGWPGTILQGDPLMLDRWLWLRRHLAGGSRRTLDAGAGSGAFAMYARRRGNTVVAASADEKANEKGRRRGQLLGLDVEFLSLDLRELGAQAEALGRFDQVICLETIEHVRQDQRLLADFAAVLKPGGRLLLTTPSISHRPLPGERVTTADDGRHVVTGYSHERFRAMAGRAGFEVEAEEFVSGPVSQGLYRLLGVLALRLRIPYNVANGLLLPLKPLQFLDRPIGKLVRYPHASVAIVARRRS